MVASSPRCALGLLRVADLLCDRSGVWHLGMAVLGGDWRHRLFGGGSGVGGLLAVGRMCYASEVLSAPGRDPGNFRLGGGGRARDPGARAQHDPSFLEVWEMTLFVGHHLRGGSHPVLLGWLQGQYESAKVAPSYLRIAASRGGVQLQQRL